MQELTVYIDRVFSSTVILNLVRKGERERDLLHIYSDDVL
jgi:hypothetical protein